MKNALLLSLISTCHPHFPTRAFSAPSSIPPQLSRSTSGDIHGENSLHSQQQQRHPGAIPSYPSTKYEQFQEELDDFLYSDSENVAEGENADGVEITLSEDANWTLEDVNAILGNTEIASEENEEDEEDEEEDAINPKRLIECSAKITLPFSAEVAFEAFSDLTRQPSWCNYLHSVEYLGLVDEDFQNEYQEKSDIPLRQSKWTVGVRGLKFSWTARDTLIQPPHRIEWESTSGMKNMGSVEFIPNNNSGTNSGNSTEMIVSFTFVAPRVVAGLFRRSNRIRRFTEDVLLMNMLTGFRDVVVEEDL
mmetsp:Transcript_12953/g.26353  ORF Transcript_12953/g.26353 Transcript_12953/m.26353 type:complete len:306 (+) Transcript_12953:137-1054(+)